MCSAEQNQCLKMLKMISLTRGAYGDTRITGKKRRVCFIFEPENSEHLTRKINLLLTRTKEDLVDTGCWLEKKPNKNIMQSQATISL